LSSKATIYTFLVIGLLVTLALIVAPVAYAISLSFYKLDSFVGHAKWVGFENYAAILKLPEFWRALWNGVVYSLGSIVLQVVLGIGFALILNETFPAVTLCAACPSFLIFCPRLW
jgi:multiple sugar transport system permease protein